MIVGLTRRSGHVAAQRLAALLQVLDLLVVLARVVVRRVVRVLELAVGDLQVEPVAEGLEVLGGQLLHLVGGVLALQGVDRPALDGLGQDHRRLADVLGRGLERRVHLAVVVAAAGEHLDLLVAHVRDHPLQPRVGEEVVPDVRAVLDQVGLELSVRGGVHLVHQGSGGVGGQQRIPVPAPEDLDHVPAGAEEERLQLLDDLAVAQHGSVELLQVAVDHVGEIVQTLPGRDPDGAERLRLAHLAVAHEAPRRAVGGVLDAAVGPGSG